MLPAEILREPYRPRMEQEGKPYEPMPGFRRFPPDESAARNNDSSGETRGVECGR